MSAPRPRRSTSPDHPGRTPWTLAVGALVALALAVHAPTARAQFGPDFRLTGPPFFVSQPAQSHAWSVATDDAGNVHVVYFDTRNGALGDVPPFYRRYDRASGTWGPEVRLPDAAASNTRYVAIAADNQGQVHVVWVHTVAGDHHYLLYKKRDASGAWGSDETVQSRPEVGWELRDPVVAADHIGSIYAAWAEGIKDASDIGVCNIVFSIKVGSSWSGVQGLTNYSAGIDPAPGAIAPTIATQPRQIGNGSIAHVAWADYPAGVVRYRAVRYAVPGGLTLLGTAPLALGTTVAPPTIAARCGEVHVAWADPGPGTIVHRHGEMSLLISETTTFDPQVATGLTGQSPSIAVDGLCNAQLVMLSGGAVVHSQRSWMSGAWSAPVTVSDPPAAPADPSVAIDPRGSVHVVWKDARTSPPGSGGAYYDLGACVAVPDPGSASVPELNAAAAKTAPVLDAGLIAAKSAARAGDRLPVIIRLRERPDLGALRRGVTGLAAAERRRQVVETLHAAAGRTQAGVLAELISAQQEGRAGGIRSLWSVGAVAAEVSPAELDRLAARDDIEAILHDPPRPMLEANGPAVPAADQGRARETAGLRHPGEADARPRPAPPSWLRGSAESPGRAPGPPRAPRVAGSPTPVWSVEWIGAPAVWDQGYRGACVLVAIIDTGVDWGHPDLAARIWTNAGETPANGIDDDGNGFVDDLHGYDTRNHDGDPMDDYGHGTHVGGSVAGDGTAGTLTGVAPEARLMAVKVLSASGSGSDASVLQGIEYAVDNGAQVLNLSLGTLCPSAASRALYRDAADAVAAAGVTMCVAAGNDRGDQRPPNLTRTAGDVPPPWISPDQPVIGATSGVTTVGATSFLSDQITYFSSPGPVDWSQPPGFGDWRICDPGTPNVGLIKPDVSAPGQDVLSTILGGGYDIGSGTSMATPHVAGLAALVLSKNTQLTSDQVDQILETTALDLGPPGKDNDYGSGRIRAPEALAATPAPVGQPMQVFAHVIHDTIPPADGDGRLERGETADIEVTLENTGPFRLGGVVGTLQDNSAHVAITDAVGAFGDIPPGELRNNAVNLFRVVVAPDAPHLAPVTFSVQIAAYGACGAVTFPDTLYDQVVGVEPGPAAPLPALALGEVAPNPAGPEATFAFAIRAEGRVRLALYDVHGRRVRLLLDATRPAGLHRMAWDGRDEHGAPAAAGVYLARVESAGLRAQRKFAWLGR